MIGKICNSVEKAYKAFYYIAGAFLFLMLVTCAFSVFTRLFGHPVMWADELIRFEMIFLAFSAAPYIVSTKGDLVVDLTEIFCPNNKKLLYRTRFIGAFILLIIFVYLIGPTFQLAVKNMNSKSSAMQIPQGIIYMTMPVGFVLCAIAQVKNIIKDYFLKNDKTEEGRA